MVGMGVSACGLAGSEPAASSRVRQARPASPSPMGSWGPREVTQLDFVSAFELCLIDHRPAGLIGQ